METADDNHNRCMSYSRLKKGNHRRHRVASIPTSSLYYAFLALLCPLLILNTLEVHLSWLTLKLHSLDGTLTYPWNFSVHKYQAQRERNFAYQEMLIGCCFFYIIINIPLRYSLFPIESCIQLLLYATESWCHIEMTG